MHEKLSKTDLQQLAETTVRQAEQQARDFYALKLPEARLDFSLRGHCAGQARVESSDCTCLRLNLQLLQENLQDFLDQTIPHEVAHLVVNWQARKKRQRPRPHGAEWQAVMQECFGLAAKRCHSYQTTPARIVTKPFLYRCNCREHRLTYRTHNRLCRSHQALCKRCRSPLELVADQGAVHNP